MADDVAAERLRGSSTSRPKSSGSSTQALVGREFEVLLEGRNRRGQATGGARPATASLHLEGRPGPSEPGTYVRARVTRGLPNSLVGR